jgi:hypothetical protein
MEDKQLFWYLCKGSDFLTTPPTQSRHIGWDPCMWVSHVGDSHAWVSPTVSRSCVRVVRESLFFVQLITTKKKKKLHDWWHVYGTYFYNTLLFSEAVSCTMPLFYFCDIYILPRQYLVSWL